jgi:hypothetical protein
MFSLGNASSVTLRNFWEVEDGFVWSRGKWCEVIFDWQAVTERQPGVTEVVLEFDVFKRPNILLGQNVLTYLNGIRIGSTYVEHRMTTIFPIASSTLRAKDNVLTLDTPDSVVPTSYGFNDTRDLGVQLFSMQIRRSG